MGGQASIAIGLWPVRKCTQWLTEPWLHLPLGMTQARFVGEAVSFPRDWSTTLASLFVQSRAYQISVTLPDRVELLLLWTRIVSPLAVWSHWPVASSKTINNHGSQSRGYNKRFRDSVWNGTDTTLVSLGERLQRRLVFGSLMIFDQPEAPTDQCSQIFGLRFFLVKELLDFCFQFRLLICRVQDLENLHRQ